MKRRLIPALILVVLGIAAAATAQSRGESRVRGKVTDDQGKPAEGVEVKAVKEGETEVFPAKTNKKGDWAINGIAYGRWRIDFTKEGFQTHAITVDVVEGETLPTISITLVKPPPDPNIEIQAQVKRAAGLLQSSQFAEARQIYTDLLAKYPELYQLNRYIGVTYAAEKNYDKAVEHMKIAVEKEPNNAEVKMHLSDVLMEKGDKAEAVKLLQEIDMSQVKDPISFINGAITLINDGKPDEAIVMIEKLMQQFPSDGTPYYYRARAYIVAKKHVEAKADLEKFVSMAAPDARELPEAKRLLEQLKDVK